MGNMIGPVSVQKGEPGDAKRRPKLKGKSTRGEKSVTQPRQQHGELFNTMAPKPLSDRAMEKESARSSMRRATANWVDGHISAKEHKAIHERAAHVLAGKHRR